MQGEKPTGYWEWFRREGTKSRSGYFEGESLLVNGLLMTGKEKCIK